MTMLRKFHSADIVTASTSRDPIADATASIFQTMLQLVRLRPRAIFGSAAAVVVLVAIVVTRLPPLYSATAVVLLDQRKNSITDVASVLSDLPIDPATVQNQVQILTSAKLVGAVADKLGLARVAEFNPGVQGASAKSKLLSLVPWAGREKTQPTDFTRMAVIGELLRNMTVEPIGLSTAIKITFVSKEPERAASIANTIAAEYVMDQLRIKRDATRNTTQWLSTRIRELSEQARNDDNAVQQYESQNGLSAAVTGGGAGSQVAQQISQLTDQLDQARTELGKKQSEYADFSKPGHAADSRRASDSPTIVSLRDQETKLNRDIAGLAAIYGPKHPKVQDANSQLVDLGDRIARELRRVADSTKNEVDTASQNVQSLQARLDESEARQVRQNRLMIQLEALEKTAAATHATLDKLVESRNRTEGQENFNTSDARIISGAEVPIAPSSPKKTLTVVMAIPAGLALGMLLAFFLEGWEPGFRTAAEVEDLLGIPVLSVIPEIGRTGKSDRFNAADAVIDKPMSSYTEAVRALFLGLSLSSVEKQSRIVLVTSSVPEEGKTTLVINLARLASRAGLRTVIVDGDLHYANVSKMLGLEGVERDFADAIAGTHALGGCLVKDARSDVMLLGCRQSREIPAEILSLPGVQGVFADLKQAFDLVIVDSTPLLAVNDAKILSRWADAVLLVVRCGKTPQAAVVEATRALTDFRAPTIGAAFARANNDQMRTYSYGRYIRE